MRAPAICQGIPRSQRRWPESTPLTWRGIPVSTRWLEARLSYASAYTPKSTLWCHASIPWASSQWTFLEGMRWSKSSDLGYHTCLPWHKEKLGCNRVSSNIARQCMSKLCPLDGRNWRFRVHWLRYTSLCTFRCIGIQPWDGQFLHPPLVALWYRCLLPVFHIRHDIFHPRRVCGPTLKPSLHAALKNPDWEQTMLRCTLNSAFPHTMVRSLYSPESLILMIPSVLQILKGELLTW